MTRGVRISLRGIARGIVRHRHVAHQFCQALHVELSALGKTSRGHVYVPVREKQQERRVLEAWE